MKPKYKVGQYIAGEDRVYARITAYLSGEEHIYALELPRMQTRDDSGTHVQWFTEFEIDEKFGDVAVVPAPDFKRYANLEAGDVLHLGHTTDLYTTVLVRVGDMVLLSDIPHDHKKEMAQVHKLSEQLRELTDGKIDVEDTLFDPETRKVLSNHGSSRYSKRIASMWKPVQWVALMNWPIVEE